MNLLEQMVMRYPITTENDRRNAMHEVMQEIALAGLYRSGFFEKAAFYGGTCLRIFHGLPRFSEDLDFSLLAPTVGFRLEAYFPAIEAEFLAAGQPITITRKDKKGFSHVESAFLKADTEAYDLAFATDKQIKIKLEVDTLPPLGFATEQKLLLQPFSFTTRCFSLPDLYAGKMHALAFRKWKNRVKGRDWYDFEWYVRHSVRLNYDHLHQRILSINGVRMDREEFLVFLRERIVNTDIEAVKRDVSPFVRDRSSLDIWSTDYFLALVEKITF